MLTELLLAATLLGAPHTYVSAPVYVATLDANGAMIGVAAPVRATLATDLTPLTVTCRDLYQPLLPLGECFLFGRVVGGYYNEDGIHPCWFDVGDGYVKTVRVYPIDFCDLRKGLYVRVRMLIEVAGRGSADEIIVMLGR